MSPAPEKRLLAAPFHRLEAGLRPVLEDFAEGEPLRPRRVVVISGLLRERLEVALAGGGALAGVSFQTLGGISRSASQSLINQSDKKPLPPLGGWAAAQNVLREIAPVLGPLRPPKGVAGWGEAAWETYKDLKEADLSPSDLRTAATVLKGPAAERLMDLALIAESIHERLAALKLFDETEVLRLAAEALETVPAGIPTIFYGFADMNALQRRFALAICRGAPATFFVPAEPGAPACAFAQPFIKWLESKGFVPEEAAPPPPRPAGPRPLEALANSLFTREPLSGPPPKAALRLIAAPSESREAWELCREIFYSGADNPPAGRGEIGLLLPGGDAYPDLLREIFRGVGAGAEFGDSGRAAATLAGRLFLSMIELKPQGYPRRGLMRFLDEGRFPESPLFLNEIRQAGDENGPLPADLSSAWEYITRPLPYLSGEGGWRAALGSPAFDKIKKVRPEAGLFKKSLEKIFAALGDFPESGPPSVHAKAAISAFESLTGISYDLDKELEAVSDLGKLDPILGEIDAPEFRRWARAALESKEAPVSRTEARVRVMSLQDARGLSFSSVVIPGMAEGVFPARGAEDPLLSDALRALLNKSLAKNGGMPPLPLKSTRIDEERFLFWTALQSAEGRAVLGYPRGGKGAGDDAGTPPSLFLEYLADACLPGEGEAGERLRRLPGFRAAAAALEPDIIKERPLTLLEHELGRELDAVNVKSARGALADFTVKPGFTRRLAAWRGRWERNTLNAFDGALSAPDLIEKIHERLNPAENSIAVTALEDFFTCPYKFALKHLLKLGDESEAELPLEAEGMDRGNLYHDALRRFGKSVMAARKGFGELAPDERRRLIGESVRAACLAFEGKGRTPLPVPWAILQGRVKRDLEAFIDKVYLKEPEWTPVEVEGSFGGSGDPAFAETDDGKRILLRGRFDLAEKRENELRFIDYKTGLLKIIKKAQTLEGGKRLQVDMYVQCGAPRFGNEAAPGAAYAYPTERGGYRLITIPAETISARREDVAALLGFYARTIESGSFFPVPETDICGYCDFVSVCGPDRFIRADRKKGDSHRISLDELRGRTE